MPYAVHSSENCNKFYCSLACGKSEQNQQQQQLQQRKNINKFSPEINTINLCCRTQCYLTPLSPPLSLSLSISLFLSLPLFSLFAFLAPPLHVSHCIKFSRNIHRTALSYCCIHCVLLLLLHIVDVVCGYLPM